MVEGRPGLQVISAGFFTTIQDEGRRGYARFGMPGSGPMDWFALRAANRLVVNEPGAAGLEFAVEGPVLEARQDALVAVTGRGFRLWIQGRRIGLWMAAWARPGERIEVRADERVGQLSPGWGYLAVAGGIATRPVLGSRSTYLRGGLGGLEGRSLVAGAMLPIGGWMTAKAILKLAGRRLPPERRPTYTDKVTVPVIPGPQADDFDQENLQIFLNAAYTVTGSSDRMGYRLDGPALRSRGSGEMLSEGMPVGSVQVPPGGQPILMMSDCPTTGGYPKIAVAARCGLPLAAQTPLGRGKLRFRAVTVDEAREMYQQMVQRIDTGIES